VNGVRVGTWAALAGLLVTLPAHGDAPARAGRVAAMDAARTAISTPPGLPRFALFGWVSPPRESTTATRYAELANAGFNLTVLAWEDSGRVADNLARLAYTRPWGVRDLLLDQQLDRVTRSDPASLLLADSIVARYRDDPAFAGWYLGDEPAASGFPRLAELFGILRERDPTHSGWNNLLGRAAFASVADFRAYLEAYVAAAQPVVLCDDHYEFLVNGDRGQMAENIGTLAAVAREHGLPFWGIVLLVQHGDYRAVSAGMLRWQVGQWLAWGARGIGTFTYWTPAPDSNYDWQPAMIAWGSGARTPLYDMGRAVNLEVAPLGNVLAGMQWLATQYAGSSPAGGTPFEPGDPVAALAGRATLGFFADSLGAPCVLVANADSLAPQMLALRPGGGRAVARLRADGSGWDDLAPGPDGRVALALDAGDFALLRFSGLVDSLAAGEPPGLVLAPNPARDAVRFSFARVSSGARLTLLDLAGRRVWSAPRPPASGVITWHGERDDGGSAVPGIYFARLEDPGGVTIRRLAWLGGH